MSDPSVTIHAPVPLGFKPAMDRLGVKLEWRKLPKKKKSPKKR
jgi:hypothetical protein